MSTFYIDPDSGNDANAGTSFATAWQTVTNGATAARIAPGDTIRIKKSPGPFNMGGAVWTNQSPTLTIAPVTTNITLCETAWTSDSANITCIAQTADYRQGSACSAFIVGLAGFSGLAAHLNLGATLNLSTRRQISFWFKIESGSIISNKIRLDLCSNTIGTTIVNSFTLPANLSSGIWYPITLDYGANLGTSIKSIAIRILSPGAGTGAFYLDNIMACKNSSSVDALSLTSLIGKNIADDGWWSIRSINGATITLDSFTSDLNTPRGYSGTTGAASLYRREVFSSSVNAINDNGTAGSHIIFSGGWDSTNMSTQTDLSFFDNEWGGGNTSYVSLENIGVVRSNFGFNLSYTTGNNGPVYLSNTYSIASLIGVAATGTATGNSIITTGNIYITQGQTGLFISSPHTFVLDNNLFIKGVSNLSGASASTSFLYGSGSLIVKNNGDGLSITGGINFNSIVYQDNGNTIELGSSSTVVVKSIASSNNSSYGVSTEGQDVTIYNLATSGNSSGSVNFSSIGSVKIIDWSRSDSQSFANVLYGPTSYSGASVQIHNDSGIVGNHIAYFKGGTISIDDTNGHGSSTAWKFSPVSVTRSIYFPLSLEIPVVPLNPGTLTTIKMWVKRSDKDQVGARLRIIGDSAPGVGNADIVTYTSADSGVYEQLSVAFTPSSIGVVVVLCEAYITGTSLTESVWFSDVSVV